MYPENYKSTLKFCSIDHKKLIDKSLSDNIRYQIHVTNTSANTITTVKTHSIRASNNRLAKITGTIKNKVKVHAAIK